MNKYYFALSVLLIIFVPFIVFGQADCPPNQICNPLTYNSFGQLLGAIVGFLMWIAAPITVIVIVISGYYFVTSMGDPEKIKTAKKMVIWALVGLIIILIAWAVIAVIENIFNITIPR